MLLKFVFNYLNHYQPVFLKLSDLKMGFSQNDLLTSYAKYISAEAFPNLVRFSPRNISLFSISYCYEQLFQELNTLRVNPKLDFHNEHIPGILRVATSSLGAGLNCLCNQRQCQTSH